MCIARFFRHYSLKFFCVLAEDNKRISSYFDAYFGLAHLSMTNNLICNKIILKGSLLQVNLN